MYAFCSCGIWEQLAAAESPVEDNWPFQYSFPGKLFPSQAYIATFSKSLSFIWKGSSSVNVTMISVSPNFWPSTRSEFADEGCCFSAFRGGIHENSTCLTCGMAFKFDNFWSVTSKACKYSGIWNDEKLHDIKKSVRISISSVRHLKMWNSWSGMPSQNSTLLGFWPMNDLRSAVGDDKLMLKGTLAEVRVLRKYLWTHKLPSSGK